MSKINRRALLVSSTCALIASSVVETAIARVPQRRYREPSRQLRALIEAHKTAYAAFGKAIREPGGNGRDLDKASRAEEKALLADCSYPAVSEGDRRTKAKYLLQIEARGELDLKEQMQAVLPAIGLVPREIERRGRVMARELTQSKRASGKGRLEPCAKGSS